MRNLFSHSYRGQKSEIQVPSEGSRGEPFLASSSFWWHQGVLGLWPHHSHLCLHHHMDFCWGFLFRVSLTRTYVIGFEAHPDSPRWPHLEVLNDICHDLCSNEVTFISSGVWNMAVPFRWATVSATALIFALICTWKLLMHNIRLVTNFLIKLNQVKLLDTNLGLSTDYSNLLFSKYIELTVNHKLHSWGMIIFLSIDFIRYWMTLPVPKRQLALLV